MEEISSSLDKIIMVFDEIDTKAKKLQVKNNPFVQYQHDFFIKIYRHVLSLKMLQNGYQFKNEKKEFVSKDFSGIVVIIRSILESYSIYNYIYIISNNKDFAMLKFMCWEREGIITRQNIKPNTTDEIYVRQLQKEKEKIEQLTSEILASEYFSLLNITNMNKFNTYGSWRPSFNKLIDKTSLTTKTKQYIYSYLSSHAHSEYLNIMQISQMARNNQTDMMLNMQMFISFEIIISFLLSYINHSDNQISIKAEMYSYLVNAKNEIWN